MSKEKWARVKAQDDTVSYFSDHLIEHLSKEIDEQGEKNQPKNLYQQASNPASVGKLSRIFDAFPFPTLSYDQLKEIAQQPDGLRVFMQKTIDDLSPMLLNEEKTALNEDVIQAIGQENYDALCEHATPEEIATQFIKAICASYAQKVLDNIRKQIPKLDDQDLKSIKTAFGTLGKIVNIEELLEQSEQQELNLAQSVEDFKELLRVAEQNGMEVPRIEEMRQALDNATKLLEEDNPDMALKQYSEAVKIFAESAGNVFSEEIAERLNIKSLVTSICTSYMQGMVGNIRFSKARDLEYGYFASIGTVLEKLAKEVTIKGLPAQSEQQKSHNLLQCVQDFQRLLREAEEKNIEVANIREISDELDTATVWLGGGEDGDPNVSQPEQALRAYNKAVTMFAESAGEAFSKKGTTLEVPEVNFFLKVLRALFEAFGGKTKLGQSAEEKRYEIMTQLQEIHEQGEAILAAQQESKESIAPSEQNDSDNESDDESDDEQPYTNALS